MIKLEHIEKRFVVGTKQCVALDNVSLEIEAGSICGIIGASGAGKTSILRCVNLLERPDKGRVVVAGHDLTSLTTKELREQRRRIGMIFQHFNLLTSGTVHDNIALPLIINGSSNIEIEKRVADLIALTGLSGKEKNYPHQLSGGQKQRVAIARALATKPDILLSDEATSALDQNTTRSILDLLREINETCGITILLITHQLEVIKSICHHVALMHQGRIIESGSVKTFFAHPTTALARDLVFKDFVPSRLAEEVRDDARSISHG